MRKTLTLGVIGFVVLALAGSAAPPPLTPPLAKGGKGGSPWLTDYAEAKAEAKRTGKPIFLVFR